KLPPCRAETARHVPRFPLPLVGRVGKQSGAERRIAGRGGGIKHPAMIMERKGRGLVRYRGLSATFQVRKGRDLDSRDVSLHSRMTAAWAASANREGGRSAEAPPSSSTSKQSGECRGPR